jgi:tetratricopeptide (TPR) repeat protein
VIRGDCERVRRTSDGRLSLRQVAATVGAFLFGVTAVCGIACAAQPPAASPKNPPIQIGREPEARALLGRGTELGKQGNLEEAARLFRRAAELDPALVDARFNLAVVLARLGRMDAAIESMRDVLRLQPKDFDAHTLLATWLSEQGRHSEALLHLERAAALEVNSRDAWLNLARGYEAAGRPQAAVGAYRRVLGLSDRDEIALLEALLRVATAAPDGPAAVDAARRLRALRPGHEGFLIVADALMLSGEVEAAVREYRMAAGLAPTSARARAGLTTALAALNQIEAAANQLLQTIKLEPDNPAHYQELSVLYERAGRLDLAIVALRDGATAATTAPKATQVEIADRLAALYDRAGMRQDALQERARAQALRSM